jgi:hypothetical protein
MIIFGPMRSDSVNDHHPEVKAGVDGFAGTLHDIDRYVVAA